MKELTEKEKDAIIDMVKRELHRGELIKDTSWMTDDMIKEEKEYIVMLKEMIAKLQE